MTNVIQFPQDAISDTWTREKYSFDMTQPDPRGFVLIDACVPLSMAVEFMNLLAVNNVD